MKNFLIKLKTSKLYVFISNIFKHSCVLNRKLISASYLKDGDTGFIFLLGKEYRCEKCGKSLNK